MTESQLSNRRKRTRYHRVNCQREGRKLDDRKLTVKEYRKIRWQSQL